MSNKFLWRTHQLISLIPVEYDGALIMSEINGKYFTGFDCDNGYFIVTRNELVYVTDSRYTEAAQKAVEWCEVVEYESKTMKETFSGISKRLGVGTLLVESERMTLSQYKMMSEASDDLLTIQRLIEKLSLFELPGNDPLLVILNQARKYVEVKKTI